MQARSGFYKAYAERLASWGYVVVQYNLPLFRVIPDANEVCFDAFLPCEIHTNAFFKASQVLCRSCRGCEQGQTRPGSTASAQGPPMRIAFCFYTEAELMQVRYLDGLIKWLEKENQKSGSPLHAAVDTGRIASAGHSRGAKLACLHFAGAI